MASPNPADTNPAAGYDAESAAGLLAWVVRCDSIVSTSARYVAVRVLPVLSLAVVVAACGDVLQASRGQGRRIDRPDGAATCLGRLPGQPESQHVRYFAEQVEKLSGGKLKVAVSVRGGRGQLRPTSMHVPRRSCARVISISAGSAHALGTSLGVGSFRALQLPFLITSYPLLQRVVRSPVAAQMLEGLKQPRVRRARASARSAPPPGGDQHDRS